MTHEVTWNRSSDDVHIGGVLVRVEDIEDFISLARLALEADDRDWFMEEVKTFARDKLRTGVAFTRYAREEA